MTIGMMGIGDRDRSDFLFDSTLGSDSRMSVFILGVYFEAHEYSSFYTIFVQSIYTLSKDSA
jgi:hypothetical protein